MATKFEIRAQTTPPPEGTITGCDGSTAVFSIHNSNLFQDVAAMVSSSFLGRCFIWLLVFLVACCDAQQRRKSNKSKRHYFYKRLDLDKEMTSASRLKRTLFKSYMSSNRPAPNATSPVLVFIKFSVNELLSYNYQSSELTLRGTFEMKWYDSRLQWSPANYSGIDSFIAKRSLWIPDIVPKNVRSLSLVTGLMNIKPRVRSDGVIYMRTLVSLTVPCMMDLWNFPRDTNDCNLTFASSNLHGQELDFDFEQPDRMASLESFVETKSEFQVTSLSVNYSSQKYIHSPGLYPEITYTITVTRRSAYYDHVFVLPAFLLLFLTPFVFLMPPTSGEKVTLGGFILMVTVLLLMMLDRFLPKGHFDVPILVKYYSTVLVLITFSMGITTVISNLGRGGQRRKRIPALMKKVFLHFLSRYVFVYVEPEPLYQKFDNTIDPNHTSDSDNAAIISQEMTIGQTVVATENDEQILKCMRSLVRRNERIDAENDIVHEWNLLAIILDRVLFVFFMLLVILCNIALLSQTSRNV